MLTIRIYTEIVHKFDKTLKLDYNKSMEERAVYGEENTPNELQCVTNQSFGEEEAAIERYFYLGWSPRRAAAQSNFPFSQVQKVYAFFLDYLYKRISQENWQEKDLKRYFLLRQIRIIKEVALVKTGELSIGPDDKSLRSYMDVALKAIALEGAMEGLITRKIEIKTGGNNSPQILEDDLDSPIPDDNTIQWALEKGKDVLKTIGVGRS